MMVQAGKKELKEHVDQSGRQLIQQTEETSMKRLIGLLIRRQSDALDLLDCVEAKAETGLEAPGRKPFGQRLLSAAAHPAVSLLLSVAALIFTAMTASAALSASESTGGSPWWMISLALLVILLIQSVLRLATDRQRRQELPKPWAEATLDLDRAKARMDHLLKQAEIDSEEIAAIYATEPGEELRPLEEDVARLFSFLYEAKMDNPDVLELDESLSKVKQLMRRLDLRPVPYGPDNRRYFRVETADYPSQMRYPAVLRGSSGELLLPGAYVERSAGKEAI